MIRPLIVFSLAATCLSSCAQLPGRPTIETLDSHDWHQVATANDRARISSWRSTLVSAVADARSGGHAADIDALGALARPDAALPYTPPPPGDYRCRIVKIGAKTEAMLHYVGYPHFTCRIRIEKDLLGFAKLTGSQRPVGLLFPDDDLRAVFLGTLVLGDEDRAMRYGADPDRDVAGVLQRVGDNRWRLLLPQPRYESQLDLIELTPND